LQFEEVDEALLEHIEGNTARYMNLIYKAIDSLLPQQQGNINDESNPLEVLMAQRRQLQAAHDPQPNQAADSTRFPPELTRR